MAPQVGGAGNRVVPEVAAFGGEPGGDDDLVFAGDGLGVAGGDEAAAELHPPRVGIGRVELALGSIGRRVGLRVRRTYARRASSRGRGNREAKPDRWPTR